MRVLDIINMPINVRDVLENLSLSNLLTLQSNLPDYVETASQFRGVNVGTPKRQRSWAHKKGPTKRRRHIPPSIKKLHQQVKGLGKRTSSEANPELDRVFKKLKLAHSKKKQVDATMPKSGYRSRKRARKTSLRRKLRVVRKRRSLARIRRRRSSKSTKAAGVVKLKNAKRGDKLIATLPRMPRANTFKFPMYATYEFNIAPQNRTVYMTPTYKVEGTTTWQPYCQAPIGFVVNLNTPHHPFTLMTNTVNMPQPSDVTDGWIFKQNQPIGMKDLLLWMNINSNARSEHIVCYATDVSYTLERPDHEIFEYMDHGRDQHMQTGITQNGTLMEVESGDYYPISHNGNSNKYLHASWISRAQKDFTNLDEMHTVGLANTQHRIDPDAFQTFKRNLLYDKRLQPDLSFMNVPTKKSTWAKGAKKWSITDYPLYAPHPFNKQSPFARAIWDQDADTELVAPYKDYSYNPSPTGTTAITDLSEIEPSKVVRMPVFVQPFNRPREMLSHQITGGAVTESAINTILDGPGGIVRNERTDTLFDLPFVRVKLKLKYHMAILPGLSVDGTPITQNPQNFDEPTFSPTNTIDP